MIDCMTLRDRMPDVAHGVARWSDAEAAHIASCEDCGREWRLVLAGAALQKHVIVSADRVAETVLGRLRSEPVPIRRIPWRGSVIGLLAAAASVCSLAISFAAALAFCASAAMALAYCCALCSNWFLSEPWSSSAILLSSRFAARACFSNTPMLRYIAMAWLYL